MRLVIAVIIAASTLVSSAFAQDTKSSPPSGAGSIAQVQAQHPGWFKEPNFYRPCPADVEFRDGLRACLGRP
jgi:hypothetical protein